MVYEVRVTTELKQYSVDELREPEIVSIVLILIDLID